MDKILEKTILGKSPKEMSKEEFAEIEKQDIVWFKDTNTEEKHFGLIVDINPICYTVVAPKLRAALQFPCSTWQMTGQGFSFEMTHILKNVIKDDLEALIGS